MIGFTLPEDLIDEVTPFLALHCPYGWQEAGGGQENEQTIILYFDNPVDAAGVLQTLTARWPSIQPETDSLKNEQWASAWKRFFTPIEIAGRFRVVPPWAEEKRDGLEPIVINPQMAFGTGHHATTSLCLDAVVRLHESGRLRPGGRFLDAGTGSGILSIACAKLGLVGFGFDLDALTLENIQENRKLNRIDQEFTAFVGTIDAVRHNRRFDLILANILAPVLIALASDLVGRLSPGGSLVLSGLLGSQIPEVVRAYHEQGLDDPRVTRQGEWACLVFS
jgi:ribosomal protein L11 methyltransferase